MYARTSLGVTANDKVLKFCVQTYSFVIGNSYLKIVVK